MEDTAKPVRETSPPEDENGAPAIPRRVRWLLILIALLIIASSAVAFALLDLEGGGPTTTESGEVDVAAPPEASFSHTCESVTCSFESKASPGVPIADWEWDFGDGETANEASPVHVYQAAGVYRVSLTLTDDSGLAHTVTKGVSIGAPAHTDVPVSAVAPPIYPFGPHIGGAGGWDLVTDAFTSAHLNGYRETVIDELNAARANGKTVILLLARSAPNYKNPDGTFSLEMWKAEVDQFTDIDFTPWIEDGTLLVHYLISEPMSRGRWGGEVITVEVLDEMARYSKQHWPNLPTTVREQPTDLILHAGGYETPVAGWGWSYLDAAWARYLTRKGPIDEFIDAEVAAAKEQGLGLLFGMNVLSGGDGSSGRIGYNDAYVMSPEELVEYGTKLISEPYGCAMIMWHLNHDDIPYFGTPEVDSATEQLGEVARSRDPIPCTPAS